MLSVKRFDVLNRELNLRGSHFLEASAGTGKTFAIEHLVVRLILEGYPLEQILVVTFTRAATRELKTRIYQNIHKAIGRLKKGDSSSGIEDYLKAICEQGEVRVQESLRLLEDALICFDGAPIFTIHGFCHRALSDFAFEGGAPFSLRDPNDGISLSVAHAVVEEVLSDHVKKPFYSPGQMALLLRHFSRDLSRLKARLAALAVQGPSIQPLPSFYDHWQQWLEAIRRGAPLNREEILETYPKIAASYKGMTDPRFFSQLEEWTTVIATGECPLEVWDRWVTEPHCFVEKIVQENRKVRSKGGDWEGSSAHQKLEWMRRDLWPILKAAKDPKAILLRLGRECQQQLERHQRRSADFFSPDRLLKQMQESLASKEFVERLKQRYKAVIIDEFQDTDPVQWSIFKTLFGSFEEASRVLCLVGDPKQSIYAFRNADLYTYLEAADHLGHENRKCLDTNFRSSAPLVDALNRLFTSERVAGWMSLPTLKGSLEVPAVRASNRIEGIEEEGRGSLHFFVATAESSKGGSRWPSKKVEQTQLFPFIATEMAISQEWGRFAVLVRDRYQAQDLWNFLQSLNIPSIICKTESLCDSEAWQGLEELVEAVCNPGDLGRLKKVLIYRWIGWGAEKVSGGLDQSFLRRAKEQILLLRECLFEKGWMAFFQAFLQTRWNTDESVEERLLRQKELDLYADLRQIGEEVAEILWNRPIRADGYTALLPDLKVLAEEQEELFKRRMRSTEGAVQILTIHMSKGLEFDTVFALGVASRTPLREGIVVKKGGEEKMVPLDLSCAACVQALEESDAEKMRQFYVALTRAKRRVYVPVIVSEGVVPPPGTTAPIDLFLSKALKEISLEGFIAELGGSITQSLVATDEIALPELKFQKKTQEGVLPPPPPPVPQIFSEWMSSYSALTAFSETAVRGEQDSFQKLLPKEAIFENLFMPLGSETGVTVHQIMELIFNQGVYRQASLPEVRACVEQCVLQTPLAPWKECLAEGIVDLLKRPFIEGKTLSDILPGDFQSEMEFLFPCDEEYQRRIGTMIQTSAPSMIKGFIDLVFLLDGKYYFIDWKTNYLGNSLEDYDQEKLRRSMEEQGYRLQAAIYQQALERYVRLFDSRPFETCFGGAFYIYFRGGVVCSVPMSPGPF